MTEGDKSAFRRRLVHGFAWESSVRLVIQIVSWASTILVARILSPDDYGLVAISGIFTGFFLTVTNLGLGAALINRSDITEQDEDAVFWINILAASGAYATLYLCSGLIADFYEIPQLQLIIKVAALIVLFSSVKVVPYARLMRELNFRFTALVMLSSQLLTTMVVLLLAYMGFGVWSLILSVLAGQLLEACVYLPRFGRLPQPVLSTTNVKSILGFGLTFTGSRILEFIPRTAPQLVASSLLGQIPTGYVQMSITLASMPITKLGRIFDRITFPAISAIKHDTNHARDTFIGIHKYLLMVTIPLFSGIALLAPEIVEVFLTKKWAPIAPLIQILCVLNVLRVSGQHLLRVLEGAGAVGTVFKYQLMSAVVLPMGMFAGSHWGVIGLLLGWLVVYPSIYILLIAAVCRELHVDLGELWQSIRSTIYSTTAMIVAIGVLQAEMEGVAPWSRLLFCILWGGAIYLAMFALFFRGELSTMVAGVR